jgi:alanyl-tRNA synthetase
VIVHIAKGNVKDVKKLIGKIVTAEVDAPRRRQITRHHTATHLLHAALRQVLGKHVTQAGSLVAPDHLRFDFTHGKALTEEELTNVERLVNEKIFEGIPVKAQENVPIAEAKNRGAMALFGEKYGDTVRTIEIEGFSLELCGGCHVKNSAEIGLFKIARQSATGSGVRRIEAVTGEGVYKWLGEIESQVKQIAAKFKTNPNNIVTVAEKLQEQLGEEKRRIERMRTQAASDSQGVTKRVGSVEIALEKLTEGELADATLVADRLVEGKPDRVAVVALVSNGKVNLVVKAGKDAQAKGAHAGNLVRDVAKIVGGGGGGRPDFATAGGKDASAIDKALEAAPELLGAQLQSN